jgi:hypothetical protein
MPYNNETWMGFKGTVFLFMTNDIKSVNSASALREPACDAHAAQEY